MRQDINGSAHLCVAAHRMSGRVQLGDGDTANSFACDIVYFGHCMEFWLLIQFVRKIMSTLIWIITWLKCR